MEKKNNLYLLDRGAERRHLDVVFLICCAASSPLRGFSVGVTTPVHVREQAFESRSLSTSRKLSI
jgi:hypothetical protein